MEGGAEAVLQAVGASLRSLLGPERSSKMCVSETGEGDRDREVLVVTDSMKVLSALTDQIQHPAGHVIHSAALGHHGNHGCEVTSLVCLAASWSQQVSELKKQNLWGQGIALPVVFAVFEECLRESEAAILSLSQPLTCIRDEYTRSLRREVSVERKMSVYSRHSVRPSRPQRERADSGFLEYLGKQLCHGRELAMSLAVKAILPQTNSAFPSSPLDLSKVMSLEVVGVASCHSRVEVGVVCRVGKDMVEIVRHNQFSSLRTVVICGDVTEAYAHRGLKRDVKISSVVQSRDLELESHDLGLKSHDPWLWSWQQFLSKYSIGVLAVEGTVSPSLYDYCLSEKIIVITRLPPSHTHTLTHITGTRPVHYISQIRHERDVGMVRVKLVEGGWSRPTVHSPNQQDKITNNYFCSLQPAVEQQTCDVTTAILCGHTHSQTSILEHSLRNSLSRLRCALNDSCIVRGGGWTEAKVADIIRNAREFPSSKYRGSIPYGMGTGWLGQELGSSDTDRRMIVEGFAAGLEDFAAAVLKSLGVCGSHFEALALVKQSQREKEVFGRKVGGTFCEGGVVSDGSFGGGVVFDCCSCKVSAWRTALQIVRTLSSVAIINPVN